MTKCHPKNNGGRPYCISPYTLAGSAFVAVIFAFIMLLWLFVLRDVITTI